ncbi:hypothetical protein MIMGU_mgv1a007505mg [Erythranthe guttata]|uniref:Peptidase A1 domain-containing protein n=1 Tax=Erythranthe guttata TaxID=4155 RepID=A0A022QL16_ERYGU|nr:hypothetical protein MIMGU_mgv1a007505mg [Erythranthe guttata]
MAETTMIFKSILIALISLTQCEAFTVDLIHRDSPHSPYYDPSQSRYQRLTSAVQRSFHRVHRFKTSSKSPRSDVINSDGEYLMKYSIGTPPIASLAIADTGSDIIWTQCQPCIQCFNQTLPIFKPKSSSTYKTIPCSDRKCKSLYETSCSRTGKNCLYSETYGDGSFTNGLLATETITLDSSDGKRVSFPNLIFGCGFKNGGIFDGGESGIVGLGGGTASLVRQLGQGMFSYCLIPLSDNKSSSSKLNFGDSARVSGISIGSERLGFSDKESGSEVNGIDGNVIIDSGTTLTLLPADLYGKYEKAIRGIVKLKEFKDPRGDFSLCYLTREDIRNIPDVTVHFKGADLRWRYENVFVRISDVAVCLAAAASTEIGIFGNLGQVNFLVGYDLVKRTVSFEAADCAKF